MSRKTKPRPYEAPTWAQVGLGAISLGGGNLKGQSKETAAYTKTKHDRIVRTPQSMIEEAGGAENPITKRFRERSEG